MTPGSARRLTDTGLAREVEDPVRDEVGGRTRESIELRQLLVALPLRLDPLPGECLRRALLSA